MNLLSSPLLSYLAFLLAIFETFTFLLCLYDVANADNGWSFSLYSLIFLSFSLSYIIEFLRVVRLGLQIGNIRNVNSKGENELEEHQRQQLKALDGFLLLVVVLSALSVVVMSIALIILSPVFPEYEVTLAVIGFTSKGFFLVFVTLGILWHLQRCHIFVKRNMPDSPIKERALRKFRFGQLSYAIFGLLPTLYYFLLASRSFPWYWYCLFGISGILEIAGQIVLEFRKRNVHRLGGSSAYTHDPDETRRRYILRHQQRQQQPQQNQPNGQPLSSIEADSSIAGEKKSSSFSSSSSSPFRRGLNLAKIKRKPRMLNNLSRVTEETPSVIAVDLSVAPAAETIEEE